jgi:MFS family permease
VQSSRPVGGIRDRVREATAAFRRIFANPAMRRLQLAWACSNIGAWMGGLALAVYAFDRDGAVAVGVLALVRTVCAGFAAPFLGTLGDRHPRVRVMVASDLVRVVGVTTMAAIVFAGGPALIVYALAIIGSVAGTAFRPAQAALVPSLARTPEELTASNVASSTTEGVGIFAGPALGGFLLALTSTEVVFLATAALFLGSALLVAGIHEPRAEAEEQGEEEGSFLRETLDGFRVLVRDSRIAVLVGLFAAQTFVDGALGVLTVVLALDALDIGPSGLGLLNSAIGVGGLLGAVAAAALIGRARLATDFGFGMLLWGLPLVVVALWLEPAFAAAAFVLVGIGNTIVDVTGDTLLQRGVPEELLARVFAIMESLMLLTVGLGSIAAPLLAEGLGVRWALAITGVLLPALTLASWRLLGRIDAAASAPEHELALLRTLPMFAPLDAPTLEYLAGRLSRRQVTAGETVCRKGEKGDAFYVVGAGEVEVTADGGPPRCLKEGDFFGEIALLREVPRTATVVAKTDAELYELAGDDFVAAVTGNVEALRVADTVVLARLAPI